MATTSNTDTQPTQEEFDDLKSIVHRLTTLMEYRLLDPGPGQPEDDKPTADAIEGANTVYKFKLLRAMMGSGSRSGFACAVARHGVGAGTGLEVQFFGDGPDDGGYLAGAGRSAAGVRIPFSLILEDDELGEQALSAAGIDLAGAFEPFELRKYKDGPVVAVAPELPATGRVVVVRNNAAGLTVQRPGPLPVQGGTHLAGVGGGKAFEFPLTNDAVTAAQLTAESIAIGGKFETFVLRAGAQGPMVALAPGLSSQGPN